MEDILTPWRDPHVNLPKRIPTPKQKHRQQNTLTFDHTPGLGVTVIKTAGEQQQKTAP